MIWHDRVLPIAPSADLVIDQMVALVKVEDHLDSVDLKLTRIPRSVLHPSLYVSLHFMSRIIKLVRANQVPRNISCVLDSHAIDVERVKERNDMLGTRADRYVSVDPLLDLSLTHVCHLAAIDQDQRQDQ
jgi:hypothetical protein